MLQFFNYAYIIILLHKIIIFNKTEQSTGISDNLLWWIETVGSNTNPDEGTRVGLLLLPALLYEKLCVMHITRKHMEQ